MVTSRPQQQRAQQTRRRICEAAKKLFLATGYAETTITDIAAEAGVAHQTVYFTFGSKAAVLAAVMDREIVGDLDEVALLDRPQVRRIREIRDPARRLERVVEVCCRVTERLASVYEIVRSGAADPEIRELLDRHEQQRWQTQSALVGMLDGALAPDIDPGASADWMYALLSHEVYWLLVRRRGWSPGQWRAHVADQAARQLLTAPGHGPS